MVVFRKMQESDLDSVAALESENFKSDAWSRKAFESCLEKEYYYAFIAADEDTHVGTILFTRSFDEADISNVCICKKYRKRGIAYDLLKYSISQMMENNVSNFTLEVRESNKAAIKLYEKAGFCNEGIRPGFYDNPKENAIIMWKRNCK